MLDILLTKDTATREGGVRVSFYADIKPQVFLDDLHAANVPRLFLPNLSPSQRTNLLNLARTKVKETQADLQKQIATIEARYDLKTQTDEVALVLKPYRVIENLADRLLKAMSGLESALNSGRRLPKGFVFGAVIFGTEETGEWKLGDHEDAKRWDLMMQKRRRLQTLSKDREPLKKQYQQMKARLEQSKVELKEVTEMYKTQSAPGYLRRRMMLLGGFALLLTLVGLVVFVVLKNPLGLLGVVLAVGCLFWMRRTRRLHREQLKMLKAAIQLGRKETKQFIEEERRLRMTYLPLVDHINELKAEYDELRSAFR